MRRSVTVWGCSLLLVASGLTACGGSSSSSNGVTSKSADQIVAAANTAVNGVKSVHVSGSVNSGANAITLDLDLVSGQGATGTMSTGGLSFQLIDLAQTVYIKGSNAFWQHFGGTAAAQLFKGKWLKASGSSGNFASFAALTNVHKLLSTVLSSHGTLVKGGTSTVDGQKVVAVTDSTKGGTLYVATTGKPYPVEVLKNGAQGGHVTFDRYGESVQLTAPATSIDVSKLK